MFLRNVLCTCVCVCLSVCLCLCVSLCVCSTFINYFGFVLFTFTICPSTMNDKYRPAYQLHSFCHCNEFELLICCLDKRLSMSWSHCRLSVGLTTITHELSSQSSRCFTHSQRCSAPSDSHLKFHRSDVLRRQFSLLLSSCTNTPQWWTM